MTLSTLAPGGRPRSRVVLLKEVDERGFLFFTNLESAKAVEIAGSDRVALCFHWPAMKTQVRVEGRARPVSAADADAYFATRPRDSQLAAWASHQSRPIAGRSIVLARFRQAKKRFAGKPVTRPPHWSGFRVAPDLLEFWYGRPHRLHDRHLFTRGAKGWRHVMLSP